MITVSSGPQLFVNLGIIEQLDHFLTMGGPLPPIPNIDDNVLPILNTAAGREIATSWFAAFGQSIDALKKFRALEESIGLPRKDLEELAKASAEMLDSLAARLKRIPESTSSTTETKGSL